ncbi:MAG: Carboxylesterase NlhH [Verrucomicrobiota bacterium]
MQAVLDQLAALNGKPIEHLTPQAARQQPSPADAVRELLKLRGQSGAPEPVARVMDCSFPGPGGEIALRIYTPTGQGPFPVILYIHGGGWVIGNLDTYDSSPRALANATRAVVVSTHYRLAPEHPFPAAHEDTYACYLWILANAASFDGDPLRVAVVGESAGGNMAAAISLRAREQQVALPSHQVLIYPVAGADMETPSFRENANATPLNGAMMKWFARHEFQGSHDTKDSRFDLLHADLRGLPETTVILAEIDPLRSGGELLVNRLREAGVKVDDKLYTGVTHEFFGMGAVLAEGRDATQLAANNIVTAFNLGGRRMPERSRRFP